MAEPMRIPLLTTDGRYIFAHTEQGLLGPFTYARHPRDDGQIDEELSAKDPFGCPFNPKMCAGGRVHYVMNPLFPPHDLLRLMSECEGERDA